MNDPSFVYRCENLAYALNVAGHKTELTHISKLSPFVKADVVFFHRPSFSLRLFCLKMIFDFRSILTMLDVDDLIFKPSCADQSPAYRNQILSLEKVKKQFMKNLKAFKLFSNFVTTTEALKEHLYHIFPKAKVLLIPNTVHYSWYGIESKPINLTIKKIVYFPGTKSHDADFAIISEVLSIFLKKHPDVQLCITGPLNFEVEANKKQIVHNNKVPFNQHWKNYEGVWINLAPLELTEFTKCKSALKVIEAAFWGIPTITLNLPDALKYTESGAIIVKSVDEVISKLEILYDEALYGEITKSIKENSLKISNLEKNVKIFVDFVKDLQK
jgi:hypothetical protein